MLCSVVGKLEEELRAAAEEEEEEGFLFPGISFPAKYHGFPGRTTFQGSAPKSETIFSDQRKKLIIIRLFFTLN